MVPGIRHHSGLAARLQTYPAEVIRMLHYAWIFLILAIIAAIFGFGGIAAAAAGIAKVLFFIFIALFVIGLLTGRRTI
jgi:uncharacterized membrane protein YtjA (UPF0391 family)